MRKLRVTLAVLLAALVLVLGTWGGTPALADESSDDVSASEESKGLLEGSTVSEVDPQIGEVASAAPSDEDDSAAQPYATSAGTQLNVIGTERYDFAVRVVELVNKERAKAGLSPLTMDASMLETAMQRAAETSVYWDHTRPNGTSCFSVFPKGNNWKGENIAWGPRTPEAVVSMWMNSADHKANILNPNFTVIGVGCFSQTTNYYYWTQCFGDKLTSEASASGTKSATRSVAVDPSRLSFLIIRSDADGWSIAESNKAGKGSKRYYSLVVQPLGTSYRAITKIATSGVTWGSGNESVAKIGSPRSEAATVTIQGPGVMKLRAGVGRSQVASYSLNVTIARSEHRFSGPTRYTTAKMIALETFGYQSVEYAVVASGDNYPDALAASSLAGALNAPVLLTSGSSLSPETRDAISFLGPKKVIVVGGPSTISEGVRGQIRSISGVTQVSRIYGSNRNETARKIYSEGKDTYGASWSNTAIIATGSSFADALSVSPYTYATKSPIFLVNAGSGLDASTLSAIKGGGFSRVVIVGGANSVSGTVVSQVKNAGLSVSRISGATRYETSAKIASFAVDQEHALSVDTVTFATGENYPDALAASSFCGQRKGPLLLVSTTSRNSGDPVGWASARKIGTSDVYTFGGENSIPGSVYNDIRQRVIN